MSTIAIYGGGFKPPTRGHFLVAEEAMKKHPDINEFIIFVGAKERNGISQKESMTIWDIYKKYFPMNVRVEPSKRGPIGEIASYAKKHPEDKILFVIGAREGNQGDLDDLKSRTEPMLKKYPNLEVVLITTSDPSISGTNARKATKVGKEELQPFLPTQLTDDEVENVFNILSPVVTESLITEGRYDSEVLKLSRSIVKTLKDNFDEGFKGNFKDKFEDVDYTLNLTLTPITKDYAYLVDASSGYDELNIDIEYNPKYFPAEYNELIAELKEVLRHEFEHIAQFNFFKDSYPEGSSDDLPMFDYLMLDYEVAAGVQGLYKRSKTTKQSFTQVLDDFLDERSDELTPKEIKKVKKTYINYAKKNLPKVVLNENATYTKQIDLIQRLAELTQNMVDNGDNIEPLPEIEFVNGDSENAGNFLGKTAYYDPATTTIVLYTEGRHPKDIARSYAHEMIHHTQHLEGRLDGLTTTDTTEDSKLNDIESEAYLNGNIKFRNWTDSLNEKKTKDPFGLNAYAHELARGLEEEVEEGKVEDLVNKAKDFTKKLKGGVKDQAKDFKSLGPLLKQWKDKTISDSGKKKLKVLLIDVIKALGIVVTYPILGITINALLSILVKKLSKGKLKGTLPSKISAVLEEIISEEDLEE